ncbi:MAG: DNA starvation/stationary phase protection protein [Actinomycetota bacterium]|jgi:starvation-inducible DNA-binding protein|nr:DNA starvation/stationary phase protection protein [Actinomycetota bacterium]
MAPKSTYTVPGMDESAAAKAADRLQDRLNALLDLSLTLKHVHWNVVGPNFIGVHLMLDPQVDAVRAMADAVAERIATLGFQPCGTPGYIATHRSWDDYSVGRAGTLEHLAALDVVYNGLIADHRKAIEEFDDLDLVTQDMLIGQSEQLEMFQWFARAHLEDSSGQLRHSGTHTEQEATQAAGGDADVGG